MGFPTLLFGVGVSCRILYFIASYLYVSSSGSITSAGEERDNLSAIVNNVAPVWSIFLFLLVVRFGCAILLWHSLGLPYNYFGERSYCWPVL